ncbi:GL14104 [Drosophila persimilis]|uniref:GL14104 n=1 Tax=Drosophila persimilis TaxID=7234 RepID=B4H8A1_DROPE|nr:GL14104 [Drosophila persimilis]
MPTGIINYYLSIFLQLNSTNNPQVNRVFRRVANRVRKKLAKPKIDATDRLLSMATVRVHSSYALWKQTLQAATNTSLSVTYQNVRGLRSKFSILFRDSVAFASHVIVFTETWLKPDILSSEVLAGRYTTFRKDRSSRRAGGVLIAVDSYVTSEHFTIIDSHPDLTNIEKLQHLRSCLRDSALETVRSLEISDGNYAVALDLLENRFNNRRLVQAHIDEILALQAVEPGSVVMLRELSDKFNSHMRALQGLSTTEQIAGCIIVQELLRNLPVLLPPFQKTNFS